MKHSGHIRLSCEAGGAGVVLMSIRNVTCVLNTRVVRDLAIVIKMSAPLAVIAFVLSFLLGDVSSMEGDPDPCQGICACFFVNRFQAKAWFQGS